MLTERSEIDSISEASEASTSPDERTILRINNRKLVESIDIEHNFAESLGKECNNEPGDGNY